MYTDSRTALTKEEAKELSIKKWEWIVNHQEKQYSDMLGDLPELANLKSYCGYCEKYFLIDHCKKCPIKIVSFNHSSFMSCLQKNHPFKKWLNDKSKENAVAVLNLIKRSL